MRASFSRTSWPDGELADVHQRADPHPHLAAGVEDVHGFLGGGRRRCTGRGLAPRVDLQQVPKLYGGWPSCSRAFLSRRISALAVSSMVDQLGVVLRGGGELPVHVPELVPQDVELPFQSDADASGRRLAGAGCQRAVPQAPAMLTGGSVARQRRPRAGACGPGCPKSGCLRSLAHGASAPSGGRSLG